MLPQNWAPPCGTECTTKYAALKHIPWRVFCKKGCDADGDTWEESVCVSAHRICKVWENVMRFVTKTLFLKIANGVLTLIVLLAMLITLRSIIMECFRACVSGCGFKFEVLKEIVDQTRPNRPPKAPPAEKTAPPPERATQSSEKYPSDVPGTSA